MESLIQNLGLDWKLLLSQAVNFLILLIVLRLTVYKPLLEMMRKRRTTIEEGLEKAAEADRRLHQITELQREKIQEAQQQGVELINRATLTAKAEEKKILDHAAQREEEMLKQAQEKARATETAAFAKVQNEAAELIREILVKVVAVSPESIDQALIQKVAAAPRSQQ